jgi:hypothetical protein
VIFLISISRVVGITGMYHKVWPEQRTFINFKIEKDIPPKYNMLSTGYQSSLPTWNKMF